jgi:hypothetical protein
MWAQSKAQFNWQAEAQVRRRRAGLWAVIGVAMACGALWAMYPLPDAARRLQSVPRSGAGFSSTDITLTPTELQALGRVNLIHRQYQVENQSFYTTIIDGTKDRHAVHDPRYCFQGAGWNVLAERKLDLPGGEANWVRATQGDREVQALFWFSDGKTRYTSVLRYWWQTTLRRMTLGRSGAEPVLVVLQSFGREQPDWPAFGPEVVRQLNL